MKSNNSLINKILFMLPLMLLVVALLLVATIGFNKSIDYKTYYQFDVRFNTTLSESNIKDYKASFEELANQDNVSIYSLDVINDNINGGIQVKVLPGSNVSNEAMQTRITTYQNNIKAITGINENAVITIEKSITVLPHTWANSFVKGLLTILVSSLVLFLYIWFRHEIKLAVSYLIAVLMGQAMVFSLVAILRLPVTLDFMVPYLSSFAVLSVLFVLLFSLVRAFNTSDKVDNKTLVNSALSSGKTINLAFTCTLAILIVLVAIAYSKLGFAVVVQMLLGLPVAIYSLLFALIPMWTGLYNRGKDTKLINKQKQAENPNKTKPGQDKLVV